MSIYECASLFREEECGGSNIVDSLVADISERYCFSSPLFKLRRPLKSEKLNTFPAKELAISYSHFRSGFRLPLISEWVDILNYYGFVPAQLFPNGISLVTAIIILLREKKIPFSVNLFSKLVMAKRYAGGFVMFQSRKGIIRLEGAPDKILDWKKCFCFAFCENWGVPTEPIVQSADHFAALQLTSEEEERFESLKNNVLQYRDYITSKRINETLMRKFLIPSLGHLPYYSKYLADGNILMILFVTGGMPFIGADVPLTNEASDEFDPIALRLEGGETSLAAEHVPLLLAGAGMPEGPSGPDPKGKRKMLSKGRGEGTEERASKVPRPPKAEKKNMLVDVRLNDHFAKGIEARNLEDLSVFTDKWVNLLYEGVARIDVSTQSAFKKIRKDKKEFEKEKIKSEEVRAADAVKIAELEKRLSESEARIAFLNEETKSLIAKNSEDIKVIKRDSLERISQAENTASEKIEQMRKKNAEEVELQRKAYDDLTEKYKQKCRENLALFKEKADQTIDAIRESHRKALEQVKIDASKKLKQAKIDAVKEFTEDEDFGKYFKAMHQNTVDDVLNTMKRLGDIPKNYDHGILFSQLPKPNADT